MPNSTITMSEKERSLLSAVLFLTVDEKSERITQAKNEIMSLPSLDKLSAGQALVALKLCSSFNADRISD